MNERYEQLETIRAYVAREFQNPQYLLDFVGVAHDSNLSIQEGHDPEQIWLIARILEINNAILQSQADLYGWARANAKHAVLRRFPISDFSQVRESQLLFHCKQLLAKEQALVTYRVWIDPASLEHVWLHSETQRDVFLSDNAPDYTIVQDWITPRFRVSGALRKSGEIEHESSNLSEKILLSPGDLFWIYFHQSPQLINYLLEGATKPVLSRIFSFPPRRFGKRFVGELNNGESLPAIRAAITLANFLASGERADEYLQQVSLMLIRILYGEGRAFAEFPLLFPFTKPFMLEFLGRRVLTTEPKPGGELASGQTINRKALQAVQLLSLEPNQYDVLISLSCRTELHEYYAKRGGDKIDVPVSNFCGESKLQRAVSWTPPPELALRTEKFGPPMRPAIYDRILKDRPKSKSIGDVNTAEDLIREARRLFSEKVKVPFNRIRPILGQAPHYIYRAKAFQLEPSLQTTSRGIYSKWLEGEIGFPISPTASALYSLVQSNAALVWTLGQDWFPLSVESPWISLVEIPASWYSTVILTKPHSKRQLCALIAKIQIHQATYYLFCLERQAPHDYQCLGRGNLLIKPDEEVWVGQDVLLDILYTGVREGPGGWPKTEELLGVAECYAYPIRKQHSNEGREAEDLLHSINKLDF